MTLDKNYSTINELNKIFSIDQDYRYFSRTIILINKQDYSESISIGDVIHYDPAQMQYVKSFADLPNNAEVFGIVESINSDLSLNVVTNGSITLNSSLLINIPGTNSGGNDIYFLSGFTAGKLQNIGPTGPNYIIKPLYYIAPHGNYTGLFRNYLGYNNGVRQTGANASNAKLISISDDGTKVLYFIESTGIFLLYSFTYSTSSSTRTFLKSFTITVPFAISPNYDIKISNDGTHLLIFDKISTNKKIDYFLLEGSTVTHKQTIFVKITGNPTDILWATDDELTSFTISTRALFRLPKDEDFRLTTHDSCSRILYYKRSINSQNPYNWKKIHEQAAFGYCDYVPRDEYKFNVNTQQFSFLSDNDLELSPGIFRTCDLYCKKKNYSLSTFCLGSDQVTYKSKNTGYYIKYQATVLPSTFQNNNFSYIDKIDNGSLISISHNTKSIFINDIPNQLNESTNRFYKCNFGVKQFKIHKKINDYYYEDPSFSQTNAIKFYRPVSGSLNLSVNSSLIPEISTLSKLTSQSKPSGSDANSFIYVNKTPTYTQNALWSSTSCTDNFFVFAFLYEYTRVSDGAKQKNLLVIRFPFDSHDGKNTFRFFTESSANSSIIPGLTGNGLIGNFVSSAQTEVLNDYFNASLANLEPSVNGSVELANLTNQITVNNPNINQLTNFKIFTSDTRYFLCTPTTTIIGTYAGGFTINANSFINSKFYNLASGEYFLKDNILYYYRPSTQTFVQQTIIG